MTVPAPRENPHLVGHDEAEAAFEEGLRTGRMHHAWLLTGAPGIGKATLAYRFARRLFAGPSVPASVAHDPASPLFRRVAENSHADLLTVERQWDDRRKRLRAEILVETVRTVPEFLHLTPAEGGWRVVIVDGAETLNRNAANALLKVLEEPPARAVLILVCAAPGRLPPTIRSRCRMLPLRPLGDADMDQALTQVLPELSPADRLRFTALADGSPGRAVALSGQGIAVAELVAEVLRAPSAPLARAHAVADKLGRSEDGYTDFMDLLRDGIAAAVRGDARGLADAEQGALAARRPLAAWCDLWHALGRLQDETERFHLDKRHAIVSALELLNGP